MTESHDENAVASSSHCADHIVDLSSAGLVGLASGLVHGKYRSLTAGEYRDLSSHMEVDISLPENESLNACHNLQ